MEADKPIAIVGGIRKSTVGDQIQQAKAACEELGRELAKKGFRIAVYGSEEDYMETYVVPGYVAAGAAGKQSIEFYHTYKYTKKFPEQGNRSEFFIDRSDTSEGWEVSFYRSLEEVDGIILLGGANSTLIAGHIALNKGLPVVAIKHFGGSAEKIWEHLRTKPALIEEEDVLAMAQWSDDSAEKCCASLQRQWRKLKQHRAEQEEATAVLKTQANKWVEHEEQERAQSAKLWQVGGFFVVFLILFIIGLLIKESGNFYTIVLMLGLCVAGGTGASVRMLGADAPEAKGWTAPILGIVAGFILSMLYLIPQLMDGGFLVPDEAITGAVRVQYILALIVAFLAGLAFNDSLEKLLQRAKEGNRKIVKGGP